MPLTNHDKLKRSI